MQNTTRTSTSKQSRGMEIVLFVLLCGAAALGLYVLLWLLAFGVIWSAVALGWRPEALTDASGGIGATYLIFRSTLPFRFVATLVLAPVIVVILTRLRRSRALAR